MLIQIMTLVIIMLLNVVALSLAIMKYLKDILILRAMEETFPSIYKAVLLNTDGLNMQDEGELSWKISSEFKEISFLAMNSYDIIQLKNTET